MNIFKQIVKEFWVPLFLSIAWVLYNIYDNGTAERWSIKNIVNVFGPTFFLLSWLTGQFFRVKKQTKVEDSFGTMERRLKELLSEIERKTNQMIGYISGGNSFCYLSITSNVYQNPNIVSIIIIHNGEHALHNVSARIVDEDKFHQIDSPIDQKLKNATSYLNFDLIIPNHVVTVDEWDLGASESRNFNIFWTARNGSYQQTLKLKRVLGSWSQETKVVKDRVISEPGFILDPANQEERYLVLYQSSFK